MVKVDANLVTAINAGDVAEAVVISASASDMIIQRCGFAFFPTAAYGTGNIWLNIDGTTSTTRGDTAQLVFESNTANEAYLLFHDMKNFNGVGADTVLVVDNGDGVKIYNVADTILFEIGGVITFKQYDNNGIIKTFIPGQLDPDEFLMTPKDTSLAENKLGNHVVHPNDSLEYFYNGYKWVAIGSGVEAQEGIPTTQLDASLSSQNEALPSSTETIGKAYKVIDATNGVSFTTDDTDVLIGDLDHLEDGSIVLAVPSYNTIPGGLVLIANQPNNSPNTVDWVVSPNITLRRGNNGGLYNIAAGQTSWSGGNATGTLWRNDTEITPTTFSNAYDGAIGDNILTSAYNNAYITDVATSIEYGPYTFTSWQDGGGGGFAVSDQTTAPDVIEPAWEIIDPRPEVRTANTFSYRARTPISTTTVVNTNGGSTPGGAQTTSLSLSKFVSQSGGQSNHGAGLDQDFFFATQSMSRINVASWTDITYTADLRITIRSPFGQTQTVTQTVGSANPSVNFDFNPQEVNQIKLEILTGIWRARGFIHSLGAATVSNPNNAFSTGGYNGQHDVLTLVNDADGVMFIDGMEGRPEYEVPANSSVQIAELNGLWYADDIGVPRKEYDWISVNGDFSFFNYFGATLVTTSNSISGPGGAPITVTYGSPNAPLTLQLEDGETETFVFNAVTGWFPLYDISSVTDTHGTVSNALSGGTSTNNVPFETGDDVILFPDGTVWSLSLIHI